MPVSVDCVSVDLFCFCNLFMLNFMDVLCHNCVCPLQEICLISQVVMKYNLILILVMIMYLYWVESNVSA